MSRFIKEIGYDWWIVMIIVVVLMGIGVSITSRRVSKLEHETKVHSGTWLIITTKLPEGAIGFSVNTNFVTVKMDGDNIRFFLK